MKSLETFGAGLGISALLLTGCGGESRQENAERNAREVGRYILEAVEQQAYNADVVQPFTHNYAAVSIAPLVEIGLTATTPDQASEGFEAHLAKVYVDASAYSEIISSAKANGEAVRFTGLPDESIHGVELIADSCDRPDFCLTDTESPSYHSTVIGNADALESLAPEEVGEGWFQIEDRAALPCEVLGQLTTSDKPFC